MLPAGNNPNLFSILRERGYHANLICLNGFQHVRPIELRSWTGDLPPIWGTHDFPSLFARFDELTDAAPFAIYVWNLITHIEHSLAVSPHASGLTDQFRRAWAIADDAVGHLRAILERKGLLENTTIVLYGDHGDDPWTHGFKAGLDPRNGTVHRHHLDAARDPRSRARAGARSTASRERSTSRRRASRCWASRRSSRFRIPASTSSMARPNSPIRRTTRPTSRTIRGPASPRPFRSPTATTRCSRARVASSSTRIVSIPETTAISCTSSSSTPTGRPVLVPQPGAAAHFKAGWQDNPTSAEGLANDFLRLKRALAARVDAKRAYIVERGVAPRTRARPGAASRPSTAKAATRFTAAARRPAPLPQRCPRSTFPTSCGERHCAAAPAALQQCGAPAIGARRRCAT